MKKLALYILFLLLGTTAFADDASVIGGFVSDYNQWRAGYYVNVSKVDAHSVKGAKAKAESQLLQLTPGQHSIRISCLFMVDQKTFLGGEKELSLNFNAGTVYKLSAVINFKTKKNVMGKYKYCEPMVNS